MAGIRNDRPWGAYVYRAAGRGGLCSSVRWIARRANYRLTLASLHANGGTSTWDLPFGFNGKGEPDIATLTKTWSTALVERAERAVQERWRGARSYVADDVITHAPTAEARSKLRALRTALEP